MTVSPESGNLKCDPDDSVVPDSLSSHIPQESPLEEKIENPFFVHQRELAPGTKLEHYEIESVLGGGGFGITYLAKDILLNRRVVIKENFPSAYSHRDPLNGRIIPNNIHDLESYNWALGSFLNEARTIAELDHPGIAKILSIFESNGTAYFAMEFIDGFSLEYLGEQLFKLGKRYTEDELKGLLSRLLDILIYLHQQGIYHRDIKPGNILLNREGIPVLIDFGAARHANAVRSLTIMTTLGYSSPEQSLGLETVGPWSDLYSLGSTLYALLTGEPPERGEVRMNEDTTPPLHTIHELNLLYSSHFLKSIDKALSPTPSDRYQNAKEWAKDLQVSPDSNRSTIRLPSHKQVDHPSTSSHGSKKAPETQRKNAVFRISMGMLLFMVFAGILLAIFDFDTHHSILPEKIKENIPLIEKAAHQIPQLPENLEAIQIPEIGIPLDSPSKLATIDHFQLRLTDSAMSSANLPTPLPASIRISAIYVMASADTINMGSQTSAKDVPYVTLVIKDSEGKTVTQSSNKVAIASAPGQTPICFTFASLPALNSSKTYTCSFVNEQGRAEKVELSCLLFSLTQGNARQYPLSRIICALDTPDSPSPKTKEEKHLYNLLTEEGKTDNTLQEILSIPSTKANTEFIYSMAEAGYPLAQFKMSKIDTILINKDNLTKGIIWLYKSAIGGYPQAQMELGALLMGSHTKFPDLPNMPPIGNRNYSQAARFLRMTFQHRDAYSLYLLGMIYGQGWGVPKSPSTAAVFYEKAQELDPSLQTKYISDDNTILSYWSPRELDPYRPLRVKCEIPLELLHRMKGIKFVGIGGLSEATASNIRLTWNNKTISAIPSPQTIVPGSQPELLPLAPPLEITPSASTPVYLELELSTKGTNSGIIELETQKTIDLKAQDHYSTSTF